MSSPADNFEASRAEKLHRIEQLGVDPWGGRFDGHTAIRDVLALPADKPDAERPKVRAAGRIVGKRGQGKLFFLDIRDWTTPIRTNEQGQERHALQVMIGQKQVNELSWKLVSNLDLGDLIGVDGSFGKTKMGEPTIFAESLTYLGKSLEPHPDKWAGMQEMEYRLRHRYLDLIYTPDTLDRTLKRIKIIKTIRNHLDGQGFVEVETPVLHAIAGGAAARPFTTHHNTLDIPLFQRIALELHLKRLLVGGIEKVYEIGRVFRNEGISQRHNPEFTMMELYQAYADYRSMMDLTEGLIVACVDALGGGRQLPYGEHTVNFEPPWQRACYVDLFREHVGVDMNDKDAVRAAAPKFKINPQIVVEGKVIGDKDHDVIVHELFEHAVEDKLIGPVFVHDYPAGLCPLTKRQRGNPNIAERFELYVRGMELANAYTELNDPITQEQTFRQQLAGLPEEDSMAKMDEDFIRALRHAMPPAGGLGVGIDRLVMLLTNTTTIRDVILFPLLRPEK
ncbi:MAG: lysine--tRNA ligase [Planctomycetia bacterium]|nr:lysine--tRNA ligase [Planctomycetia bacterium]